jgi:hypothetical protein
MAAGLDLGLRLQQHQVFTGHLRIVERKGGRADPAQYFRLRDEIAQARFPVGAQVVDTRAIAGDQQRRKRRRQDDERQLESNRARYRAGACSRVPCAPAGPTASSREESFRRLFSAESSAISKRTRRSASTKLMTLPCASAPSDLGHRQYRARWAAAPVAARRALSAFAHEKDMNPSSDSPAFRRRTVTGRSFTVRPATACASSAASGVGAYDPDRDRRIRSRERRGGPIDVADELVEECGLDPQFRPPGPRRFPPGHRHCRAATAAAADQSRQRSPE